MFFKKNGYAPKKTQISTRYWFIALDTVDWQSIGGTSFPFTKETKRRIATLVSLSWLPILN